MRKLLLTVAVLALTAGVNVGCDKNKSEKSTTTSSKTEPVKMSTDDCAMCPGTQTADANGKCPKCGMKVKG